MARRLRADEDGIVEHFARVAEAARIPIMVQDAPLSGVTLSVPLLARLAREVPLVSLFQDRGAGHRRQAARPDRSRAATRSRARSTARRSITLMADLDAGATGTMPSALLPDLIKPVVTHHRAGRRDEAAAAYAAILPLINYENRQCGLRATKTVMMEGGVIKSDAVRHPLEPLDARDPRRPAGACARARTRWRCGGGDREPIQGGGGRTRARTWDPLIKSQLLYQLSYAPECSGNHDVERLSSGSGGVAQPSNSLGG